VTVRTLHQVREHQPDLPAQPDAVDPDGDGPWPESNEVRPAPHRSGLDRDRHSIALFATLSTSPDPARRHRAREQLIEMHAGFAEYLARRFRNRGEPMDDLRQVAMIGLIKAIDGFDARRGNGFASYAVPTILGELRRHFRDKGWNVRVPRRLQELGAEITGVSEWLTQELGRTPTTLDIADALSVSEDDVREGLFAAHAYSATSLNAPLRHDDDGSLSDLVAEDEDGYERAEATVVLRQLIPRLPTRERRIIGLRFYHQLTQSEIAAELGISQMHVSRLLSRSLTCLREELAVDGESRWHARVPA